MPWASLKNALLFNAVCSALLGVALLLAPSWIMHLMGDFNPLILTVLGVALLLFAVDVALIAIRNPIPLRLARWITRADMAWVMATPVVMAVAAPWLGVWGHLVLLDVALLVACCAYWQNRGLQRAMVA